MNHTILRAAIPNHKDEPRYIECTEGRCYRVFGMTDDCVLVHYCYFSLNSDKSVTLKYRRMHQITYDRVKRVIDKPVRHGESLIAIAPPILIRTNHITRTEKQCFESGERDGHDGIRWYDCYEWETVEGDSVRGDKAKAAKAYAKGYRKGRLRRFFKGSSFPSSGDQRYDAEVLALIDPALFMHGGKLYYKSMGKTFRVACMPNSDDSDDGKAQAIKNANYFMECADDCGVMAEREAKDGDDARHFIIICAIKETKLEN